MIKFLLSEEEKNCNHLLICYRHDVLHCLVGS